MVENEIEKVKVEDINVLLDCQTSITVVVNKDDFLQQDGRCGLQHTVDGPQQSGPGFVVEGDDHGGGGQMLVVELLTTASEVGRSL